MRLYPYRIEHWMDGAVARVLVVLAGPKASHARCLSYDTASRAWLHAEARLSRQGFSASRERIVASLPFAPATARDAQDFSAPGPYREDSVPGIARYLGVGTLGMPMRIDFGRSRTHAREERTGFGPESAPVHFVAPRLRGGHPGFAPPFGDWDSPIPEALPPRVRLTRRRLAETPAEIRHPGPDPDDRRSGLMMIVEASHAVAPALRFLAPLPLEEATACVPAVHWSPDSDAYYSAPGEVGLRRRQAAHVHPALAPAFPHAPAVTKAIDAGRPFEAALAAHVGRWFVPPDANAPDAALMRRLRELPPGLTFRRTCRLIRLSAMLGRDLLPDTAEGWDRIDELTTPIADFCAQTGLDLRCLALPVLKGGTVPPRLHGMDFRIGETLALHLNEAVDMVSWCADTLVTPVLHDRRPPPSRAHAMAARLLLHGKGVPAVIGLTGRWHEGLPRLQALLPYDSFFVTWPALFAPFEAEGTRVACLTTPGELREEGVALAHCVAGYAAGCFTGDYHVASVRSSDGRALATLQLAGGGPVPLRTVQRSGRKNAPPCAQALRAEESLIGAIAEGRLPLDPAALVRRDPALYRQSDIRVDEASLRLGHEAWAPFLPAYAREFEAMVSALRGMAP